MCKSQRIEETEFSLPDRKHWHCLGCGYFFSEEVKASREYSKAREGLNVEVVDFHTIAKSEHGLQGILDVLLVDIGVHLKGIQVNKNSDQLFFTMPHCSTRAIDGNNYVRYPVFSYTDSVKTQALRSLIAEKGKEYIDKNYLKD